MGRSPWSTATSGLLSPALSSALPSLAPFLPLFLALAFPLVEQGQAEGEGWQAPVASNYTQLAGVLRGVSRPPACGLLCGKHCREVWLLPDRAAWVLWLQQKTESFGVGESGPTLGPVLQGCSEGPEQACAIFPFPAKPGTFLGSGLLRAGAGRGNSGMEAFR